MPEMATAEELDSAPIQVVTKELTCPSCKKEFVNPKLLRCLHTFCQRCVQNFRKVRKGNFSFQCPFCRSVTKTSDSFGHDLPTNVYVTGLLDILASRRCKPSKCLVCTLKDQQTQATHKCLDCGDTLCQPCSKGHNSSSSTSTHLVVSLDDLRKGRVDMQIMRRQSTRCVTHKAEYRFYCNNCSSLICEQCAITEHRYHSHKNIDDALQEKASKLDKLIPQNHTVRIVAKRISELQAEEKEFRTKLTMDVIAIVEQLHRERKEILKTSRAIFQEERNTLMSHLNMASVGAIGLYTRVLGVGGYQLLAMSDSLEAALKALPKTESGNCNLPVPRKIRVNIAGYCPGKEMLTLINEKLTTEDGLNKIGCEDASVKEQADKALTKTSIDIKESSHVTSEKDTHAGRQDRSGYRKETPAEGKVTDKWSSLTVKDVQRQQNFDTIDTAARGPNDAETEENKTSKQTKSGPKTDTTDGMIVDAHMTHTSEDKDLNERTELVTGKTETDTPVNCSKGSHVNTTVVLGVDEHKTFGEGIAKAGLKDPDNRKDNQESMKESERNESTGIAYTQETSKDLENNPSKQDSIINRDEGNDETSVVTASAVINPQDIPVLEGTKSSPLLVYKSQFETRQQSDSFTPSISCMVSGPDESVLVLDENNYKLLMFDKNYTFTCLARPTRESFLPQMTAYSQGFASASDNMLLFCRKDLLVTKAIYLCSNTENKYIPMVCKFQEGLLVGNLPHNEMRAFDGQGNVLRSWKSPVPGPFISLKYAYEDRVVICTWANNGAVYIESEKHGILLEIYRSICVGDKIEAWYPRDSCVTHAGYVIVSDSLRDEITVFSKDGNLLSVTKTTVNNIREPRCLLVDGYNTLLVSGNQGVVGQYKLCNV